MSGCRRLRSTGRAARAVPQLVRPPQTAENKRLRPFCNRRDIIKSCGGETRRNRGQVAEPIGVAPIWRYQSDIIMDCCSGMRNDRTVIQTLNVCSKPPGAHRLVGRIKPRPLPRSSPLVAARAIAGVVLPTALPVRPGSRTGRLCVVRVRTRPRRCVCAYPRQAKAVPTQPQGPPPCARTRAPAPDPHLMRARVPCDRDRRSVKFFVKSASVWLVRSSALNFLLTFDFS